MVSVFGNVLEHKPSREPATFGLQRVFGLLGIQLDPLLGLRDPTQWHKKQTETNALFSCRSGDPAAAAAAAKLQHLFVSV